MGKAISRIGPDSRLMSRRATIRPAHGVEIPAVLELWRAETVASATDSEKALRELCALQPGALLVAEQDGALVGTVIAAWDGWRGNLYRLAVRSSHRRRGIASALIRAAERHLREQGATRISALVFDADDALGLAEAVGAARDQRLVRFVQDVERGEGVQSHSRDS
jgi:ribosomal protein S18 acetylase RimI-like enzyme